MTPEQQTAMTLALEALEEISALYMSLPNKGCIAITALRQALEQQPEQESSPLGILFAVDFDSYEAERKALAGINATQQKGNI